VNVAVTLRAAVMLTVHVVLVPVHAPLQPVKVERVVVTAAKVTLVPLGKLTLQVAPQYTPAGLEAMRPLPLPVLVTVSVEAVGVLVDDVGVVLGAKVAVRRAFAPTTSVQPPVPVHTPLQPVKVEPVVGVALRATLVPEV
jgi:hypothetical protein